jgi:hypothetical protein
MSHLVSCHQETRLRRIVERIGLPEDAVRFEQAKSRSDLLSLVDSQDHAAMVVELQSGPLIPQQPGWLDIRQSAAGHRDILLFGPTSPVSYRNEETSPRSKSPKPGNSPPLSKVQFSDDAVWGPLQGLRASWPLTLEYSPIRLVEPSGFWHPLITIRDEPWFLRGKADGATVFLWNSTDLPDITESLEPVEEDHCDSLLRLLPLLVFCRHAFAKKAWHVPVSFANLIIDDPPVRDRYGFFAPARHLASLADTPHATTVAFIPWNWNRSTAAAADLFRSHHPQLSLCIHGCDHTKAEFASLKQTTLSGKCRLALQRAERFRQRTELSCEPVMVFPQGLFSKAAVAALRETNFLAAVNSTLFPIDAGAREVCLADLIEPAFMRIADFPVFPRRYPRDPVLCAVDLFLGRHLLVVEHHEYFRDGYAECRRFLEAINSFRSPPVWAPLDQIVRRSCLQRELEPGKLDVRFYTDLFVLENSSAQKLSYRLARRCTRSDSIRGVLVNGMPVDHAFDDDQVVFSFDLDPQTVATVRVVQNDLGTNHAFKASLSYRVRVWARRSLCDLRDNHVWISKCALWIKRANH